MYVKVGVEFETHTYILLRFVKFLIGLDLQKNCYRVCGTEYKNAIQGEVSFKLKSLTDKVELNKTHRKLFRYTKTYK